MCKTSLSLVDPEMIKLLSQKIVPNRCFLLAVSPSVYTHSHGRSLPQQSSRCSLANMFSSLIKTEFFLSNPSLINNKPKRTQIREF